MTSQAQLWIDAVIAVVALSALFIIGNGPGDPPAFA